jgi:aspartate-semialdehyde dehydrogenase
LDKHAKPVVAIIGSGSLLGREIRDLLPDVPVHVKLVGADKDEAGTLTEQGGEAVLMTKLDEENLEGARLAFLAGSQESSRKALEALAKFRPGPAVVDLTYALEDRPGAYLRAPMAEPGNYATPAVAEHVIAHPAATVLAVFLARLHQAQPVRRAIAQIFEPASERGHRGVEELEKQVVNLLSFRQLPKTVYGDQVGFNVLARYGAEAAESLESIELRVERHLASLLSLHGGVPMPSLRVIQVSVFHGHSISLWVEFESNPEVETLEKALASANIDVRGADLDAPNIVGMAGQSGLAVGAIAADRNDARAAWFFIAADNIRIMAENAVAVARPLVGQAGTARPQ